MDQKTRIQLLNFRYLCVRILLATGAAIGMFFVGWLVFVFAPYLLTGREPATKFDGNLRTVLIWCVMIEGWRRVWIRTRPAKTYMPPASQKTKLPERF